MRSGIPAEVKPFKKINEMETTEIIDTVATTVENACQMGEPIPEWPDYNVADYFLNGGVGPMTVITLFLIAVLVSA